MDTITESSSFMSDKVNQKLNKYYTNLKNGSKISIIKYILCNAITDNEILDYLNMHKIANNDISKLSQQKKSIMTSIRKDENINYSFVKEKKLELKKY